MRLSTTFGNAGPRAELGSRHFRTPIVTLSNASSRNPLNQPTLTGMTLSAAMPLLVGLVANAFVFAAGIGTTISPYAALSSNPPGWMVSLVWLVLYPMWGLARWSAWQAGSVGRRESWWLVALMGWGLLYSFTFAFEIDRSVWANIFGLLLAGIATLRIAGVSRSAAWWIVPSVLWTGLACFLGLSALAQH